MTLTADQIFQLILIIGTAFGGSWLGSKVSMAKMEMRLDQHDKDLSRHQTCLDEHEGTLTNHSIQLAVIDGSGGRQR